MDGVIRDARKGVWLNIMYPILFLFLLIVIKFFLRPVRRAVVVYVINKGARVAGLLALFEIKQIGRSFISNSSSLFVVVYIVRGIDAAHRRWI